MTKRIAVIIDGVVDNVIAQPDDYQPGSGEVDVTTLAVGVGYLYDGENFTAPGSTPNTPDNPYFGKQPKLTKDFWGHMLGVYIAMAPGATLAEKNKNGMSRLGRLLTSQTAAPIVKIVDGVTWVDPDDKEGDFLRMLDLLVTTQHEDGQLLMETAERDAAMGTW